MNFRPMFRVWINQVVGFYVSETLVENDLSLYYLFIQGEFVIPVNNQGFVKDLLEEACKFLQTVQTDKMRLVEITQNKIQGTVPANTNIDELDLFNKSYRIEVFYFLCILYDSNFQKQLFGDCLGNGAKQSIIVKRLWAPPPPPLDI